MNLLSLKKIFVNVKKKDERLSAEKLRALEDVDLLFIFVSNNYFIEIYDNGYLIVSDYNDVIYLANGTLDYRNTVFHINQVRWLDEENHINFTNELDNMELVVALDLYSFQRFQHNSSSAFKNKEIIDSEKLLNVKDFRNPETELFKKLSENSLLQTAHSVLFDNSANLTDQQLEDIRYIFFCELPKKTIAEFTNRSNTTVHDSYKLAMKKITDYFNREGV